MAIFTPLSGGGDTANTEWEFLTQSSMLNCQGGIPYNQYINHNIETFVADLEEIGYSTLAIHPFYASGYSRSQVYDFMGFDQFISLLDFDERYAGHGFCEYLTEEELEDSPKGMYIRNKISDEYLFEKTIEMYEACVNAGDEPLFIFDVTMQNHGAYTYDNYVGAIEVNLTGNEEQDCQLSQYLSLEYETDQAFEQLISYYESCERNVIIVMFGDHQPDLDMSVYNCILGKSTEADEAEWTEEEKNMRYIVPYVVWTNVETDLANDYANLSANYVSLMISDYAGLAYNSKMQYMNELYQKYPIISAKEVSDSDGNYITTGEWNVSENEDASFYKKLQYYYMFDR